MQIYRNRNRLDSGQWLARQFGNHLRRCGLSIALLVSLAATVLAGNPVGEQVVSGTLAFDRSVPGILTIGQATDRAIINWREFSIGSGNVTRFEQPGPGSAVLNRILGGDPSSIYGQLHANGRVFLINPAGILVGESGLVDTKGLVASTLDLSNESFLKDAQLTFAGDSEASVRNLGEIRASGGDVHLIGRSVENGGGIYAYTGTVGLGGGNEVILSNGGSIAVMAGDGRVDNSGAITAARVGLNAVNGNLYALAINNSGVIRANRLEGEGGRLVLRAEGATAMNSGSLIAPGGEVHLLGDQVGLDGAIDVSGAESGGIALIGGGFQGAVVGIPNARRTVVGAGATVNADAGPKGDGGNVVVWADDLTSFNGTISARGGSLSGEGGRVEVSGREHLAFAGAVDVSAANGLGGSILLDPRDLSVVGAGVTDAALSSTGLLASAPDSTSDATVSASAIAALNGNVALEASRDLSIDVALALPNQTSGETVTFTAGGNLSINAPVSTGGGAMTFKASSGGVNSRTATLTILGQTSGGDVTFQNDGGSGGILLSASLSNPGKGLTFTGNTKVTSDLILTGRDIVFNSRLDGDTADVRTLTVVPSGTATFSGTVGTLPLKALIVDGGGTAVLNGGTVKATTLAFKTPVQITRNTTLNVTDVQFYSKIDAATSKSGSLTINASNNTVFDGAIGGTAGSGTITTLTTDSVGKTTLKGGGITANSIRIADPLVLGANTTLTGNASITGTVDGDLAANARQLSLVSPGTSTLAGDVGAGEKLGSITSDSGGATVFRGGVVNATTQTYSDNVNFGADATLTGTTVTFNGTLNGSGKTLHVNASGVTTFGGNVGTSGLFTGLVTDTAGSTTIRGTALRSRTLTLNDPVSLGADVVITAATQANLLNTVNGDISDTRSLTINSPDLQIGAGGLIGFSGLVKKLTTDAAGSTTIDASQVRATTQEYKDPIKLGADLTLTGAGITLNKGAVNKTPGVQKRLTLDANTSSVLAGTTGGVADGDGLLSITTSAAGTTTLKGTVYAETQTYNDKVLVGGTVVLGDLNTGVTGAYSFSQAVDGDVSNTRKLLIDTGDVTFQGSIGLTKPLGTLGFASTAGTATIQGGLVSAKVQDYQSPVTLTADTTLKGTTITINTPSFGSDSPHALTVNASGVTTFDQAIAGGGFTTLTTDAAGSTRIDGSITTSGAQTYNDAVIVGVDSSGTTYILDAGAAPITFNKTIEADSEANLRSLTLTSSGLKTVLGNIGNSKKLAGLTVDGGGSTSIGSTTIKATTQTFTDPVVLAKATGVTTLTAETGTGGGAVSFGGTLDGTVEGAQSLVVNSDGATTFTGAVGAIKDLKSLQTDDHSGSATDSTILNGGQVHAVTQIYNDTLVIDAGGTGAGTTTLTGTTVSLAGGVNAATGEISEGLVINASGVTTIGGVSGGSGVPLSLTTDLAGSTVIESSSVTAKTQTYNDAVTLAVAASSTVTLTGATAVDFENTLNARKTDDAINLTVAGGGTTTFGGAVGGTGRIATLSAVTGPVRINTGAITTTGAQSYGAAASGITVGATATLTASSITLGGKVDADATANARALSLVSAGTTTFGGNVGDSQVLERLTTDSDGSVVLSSSTSSFEADTLTFNDALTLNAPTSLVGTDIFLNAPVTAGGHNLTLNAAGITAINAALTGTGTVSTDADGITRIGGNITTTGAAQTYGDDVEVTADTTLTGQVISFGKTVNADLAANQRALTIADTGAPVFTGAVGNGDPLGVLTVTGTTINIDGGSVDAGIQVYNQGVEIGASTVFKATDLTFTGAVQGSAAGKNLTLSASGNTVLTAGIASNIASFRSDNGGTTTLGANITTTANQTFVDSVVLGASVTLDPGAGNSTTFDGTIDGTSANTQALTLARNGTVNAAVGDGIALSALTITGTSTIAADVITGGAQTYTGLLTLDAVVTLNAGGALTATAGINGGTANNDLQLVVSQPGIGATASKVDVTKLTDIGNLTFASPVTFNTAGTLDTTGAQTYADAVTVEAATTLAASGLNMNGAFSAGGNNLSLSAGGVTAVNADVGSGGGNIVFDGGGVTVLNASVATTGAGDVTFSEALLLGGDSTLATGADGGVITLGSVVGNENALTLNGADTSASSIDLQEAVSGLSSLDVSSAGSIRIAGDIASTGAQTYNNAVVLSGATTLTGSTVTTAGVTGAYALTIAGDATLASGGSAINGPTSLSVSGTSSINGDITTAGPQTYSGAVTIDGASTLAAGTGAVTFGSSVSAANVDLKIDTSGIKAFAGSVTMGSGDLTATGGGSILVGGDVTSSGAVTLVDAVTLTQDVTFTGDLVATGGIDGDAAHHYNVTFVSADPEIGGLSGHVDVTKLTQIGNLSFGSVAAISGGAGPLETAGTQTYQGDTLFVSDPTLASTGTGTAGDITFAGKVDGPSNLGVNTAGTTRFDGEVGGLTALNGLITDASGTTRIAADVTASTVTFSDSLLLAGDVTVTGNLTAGNAIDGIGVGAEGLHVVGNGTFGAALGDGVSLQYVTVSGTTSLADNVSAVGALTFGATTLTGDVILTGTLTATTITGGANNLVIASANPQIGAVVSTVDGDVVSFTSGNLTFDSTINYQDTLDTGTGNQTFNGNVTMVSGPNFLAGGTITTGPGVTISPNTYSLTMTGSVVLGGPVTPGKLTINGPSYIAADVTTTAASTGDQTYNGAVTLGGNVTLTANGGGVNTVIFASTIDGGGYDLTVNAVNATKFQGAVSNVGTLTTDLVGSESTEIGADVSGTTLIFNDDVVLKADSTLTGTLTAKSIDGTQGGLVVASANPQIGGTSATVDGAALTGFTAGNPITFRESLQLTGNVSSGSGDQTYDGEVTLTGSATLSGDRVDILGGVAGTGQDLKLAPITASKITGDVSGIGLLTVLGVAEIGETGKIISVTTSANQVYGASVTMVSDVNLKGAELTAGYGFNSSGGAHDLTLDFSNPSTVYSGAAIGGTVPFNNLTISDAGHVEGTVLSGGTQTYRGAIVLNNATTLTSNGAGKSGDITFHGGIDGQGANGLVVNTAGVTTFTKAVKDVTTLTTDAAGSTRIGSSVSASTSQIYNDPVSLTGSVVLGGSGSLILNAVNGGANNLTLSVGGDATLLGSIADSNTLTIDGGGKTIIGASGGSGSIAITSTGSQTIADNLEIREDTILSGVPVTLLGTKTVDSGKTLSTP